LESETIAEELEEYEYAPTAVNQTSHFFKLPQRLRFDSGDNSKQKDGGNSCPEDIVKQSERKEVQIDTSHKNENPRRTNHDFKRNLTPLGIMSATESKSKR